MTEYFLYNSDGFYTGSSFFEVKPDNGVEEMPLGFIKPKYVNGVWVEGATTEEIAQLPKKIALHVAYPSLANLDYKLIQLDNLEGIVRETPISNKGLKGEKKYFKDNLLIWSSEKKYWFEPNPLNPNGFVRVTKLFYEDGTIADQWNVQYDISSDDKELFKKQQREMIFEYFKSQQRQLFDLLYAFFKEEIDRYVMRGGTELALILQDAALNHPAEIVKQTLNQVIPTQSGGTVTVLDGILYELV